MFGQSSSLFAPAPVAALQQQTSLGAGVQQALPLPQRNYLTLLQQRLERVESLINDESAAAVSFSYELDPAGGGASASGGGAPTRAHQQNQQLQQQLQQLQQQNPQQAGDLLVKWQRAMERNPDAQDGLVVPVRGLSGLKARVSVAAQRAKVLTEAATALCRESESLNKKHAEMNQALERVRRRHSLISHNFIQVVGLIEGLAWSRGVCEANPRGEAANEQLLMRLQALKVVEISPKTCEFQREFQWSDWQQRIDVLRVWLSTLQQEQQTAPQTSPLQNGQDDRSRAMCSVAPDSQVNSGLLQHLTTQAETVEALLQSLANTECLVSRMEEAVAAARNKNNN